MINILLDTNILRKNLSLDGAAFQSIKKSANLNRIKIHIPYMIENEYLSQLKENYQKDLRNIQNSLKSLQKKKQSEDLLSYTKKFLDDFEEYSNKIEKFVIDNYEDWCKAAKVVKHALNLSQSKNVFRAYFDGTDPYPVPKSRKDIPDSFIYENIKEILNSGDILHVIIEDGNLRNAIKQLNNTSIYESLEEFIESKIYQDVLEDNLPDERFNEVKFLLKGFNSDFHSFLEYNIESELEGKTFKDYEIPDDNNEATITGSYEPDHMEIFYDSAINYGNGNVVIPFELSLEALVDYFIFKSNYYTMDNERAKYISVSDHNDHYFWAEEYVYLKISGNLSIPADIIHLDNNNPKNIFNFDQLKLDSIEKIEIIRST